jgi:Ni/Co efflux regulator RcnB
MSTVKKTSWQLVAVAAAALLGGVAQADGREHRGRGDDHGWRHQDRQQHRHYEGRHDRYNKGWHHGRHKHYSHRPQRWSPPPKHWRHGPPHHRHYYDSYYRSNYWVPDHGGVRVVIGFPLY